MSDVQGPLPKRMENWLLIVGAVALGFLLMCGLCAVIILVLALLGPVVSSDNVNIIRSI
jgi:hypothetical protein